MKILLVGFRDPNHSLFGGYDQIRTMEGKPRLLLADKYPFGTRFKTHWMKIATTIMDIHARILCHKYNIVHFFYGELTCLPFPYAKYGNTKTVITLHLNIVGKRVERILNLLNYFDGIIVLSSHQKEYLKKMGFESVFIPHGFNTPVFNMVMVKDNKDRELNFSAINIVTIGSNYRDFDTLKRIIEDVGNNSGIKFHLVGIPGKWQAILSNYDNVSIYKRLNDDEYYSLLSCCDYNFLPLTFATANNTLLEAQSIGITSILPQISGIADYGAPAPLNLYYNRYEELLQIFNKIGKNGKNSDLIRFSKKFSWENVNNQIVGYYSTLAKIKR